jgi:hypothetical protein
MKSCKWVQTIINFKDVILEDINIYKKSFRKTFLKLERAFLLIAYCNYKKMSCAKYIRISAILEDNLKSADLNFKKATSEFLASL